MGSGDLQSMFAILLTHHRHHHITPSLNLDKKPPYMRRRHALIVDSVLIKKVVFMTPISNRYICKM